MNAVKRSFRDKSCRCKRSLSFIILLSTLSHNNFFPFDPVYCRDEFHHTPVYFQIIFCIFIFESLLCFQRLPMTYANDSVWVTDNSLSNWKHNERRKKIHNLMDTFLSNFHCHTVSRVHYLFSVFCRHVCPCFSSMNNCADKLDHMNVSALSRKQMCHSLLSKR